MNSSPKLARLAFMVLVVPLVCMLAITFRRSADLVEGMLWLLLLPNVLVLALPQIIWAAVSLPRLVPGSYRGGLWAVHALLVGVVAYVLLYPGDGDATWALSYYALAAPAIILGAVIGSFFERHESV